MIFFEGATRIPLFFGAEMHIIEPSCFGSTLNETGNYRSWNGVFAYLIGRVIQNGQQMTCMRNFTVLTL